MMRMAIAAIWSTPSNITLDATAARPVATVKKQGQRPAQFAPPGHGGRIQLTGRIWGQAEIYD